jgi:hypothetical protein
MSVPDSGIARSLREMVEKPLVIRLIHLGLSDFLIGLRGTLGLEK